MTLQRHRCSTVHVTDNLIAAISHASLAGQVRSSYDVRRMFRAENDNVLGYVGMVSVDSHLTENVSPQGLFRIYLPLQRVFPGFHQKCSNGGLFSVMLAWDTAQRSFDLATLLPHALYHWIWFR